MAPQPPDARIRPYLGANVTGSINVVDTDAVEAALPGALALSDIGGGIGFGGPIEVALHWDWSLLPFGKFMLNEMSSFRVWRTFLPFAKGPRIVVALGSADVLKWAVWR